MGRFYNPETKTCKDACDAKEYVLGNACIACYEGCSGCRGPNLDDCLGCVKDFYFTPASGECVRTCKDGFYLSPSGFCDKCVNSWGASAPDEKLGGGGDEEAAQHSGDSCAAGIYNGQHTLARESAAFISYCVHVHRIDDTPGSVSD